MIEHRRHPRLRLADVTARTDVGTVPFSEPTATEGGTATHQHAVTVSGRIRGPGLGAMIEVNGNRALVYGRRFEARIPLFQDANTPSAPVVTNLAAGGRSKPVRVTRTPLSP